MDAAAAAKLVLARRQSKKDEDENQRWQEECGGDAIVMLVRRLARRFDRFRAKPPSPRPSMTPEDMECALEELTEQARQLFALAEAIDRAERHKALEAAVAAGAPRRRPVIITPRVRHVAGLGREPRSLLQPDRRAGTFRSLQG
jgi:hypothetical protein